MSYIGNQPVLQTTQFRDEFPVTASTQTAFYTGGFHPSAVSVYRNGVLLSEDDYVKGSDNVTITLNNAAVSGDIVVIEGNRSLAQGVNYTESKVEYTWQLGDSYVQLNTDVIPAYTDVFLNGVKLAAADYTVDANAKTVSFGAAGQTAPAVGDVIAVVHKNEASALVALPLKDSSGAEILSESAGSVVLANVDTATIGSNALVVDASGNVGIGTSSPRAKVDFGSGSGSGTISQTISEYQAVFEAPQGDYGRNIGFAVTTNEICAAINTVDQGGASATGLSFSTGTAGSISEKMLIDRYGNVLVSTTDIYAHVSSSSGEGVSISGQFNVIYASRSNGELMQLNRQTSDGQVVRFRKDGTTVGNISVTSSSTSYHTQSDYRLKENITEITDGITRVKQLNPSRFNFIVEPDNTVDGFIAHEVSDIVPEAVSGEKDAVNEDGSINPQGLDLSKLVPLLTAALQESIAKIESLETRIAQLESK